MTDVVLDASVAVESLLDPDRASALRRIVGPDPDFHVPDHFDLEVLSVLRRLRLAGSLDEEGADSSVRRLRDLPVTRTSAHLLADGIWAHRDHLTVYDAAYVVLAERLGLPLLTADERIVRAPGVSVSILPFDRK